MSDTDIIAALTNGDPTVIGDTPRELARAQGWTIARSMIRERLPLWLTAAGLDVPSQLPPVDGLNDLPAILALMSAVPADPVPIEPEDREMGLVLAQVTNRGALRAIEVALEHVQYEGRDRVKLCRVQLRLETLLARMGSMAWARHRALDDASALFDLKPWQDSTDALVRRLRLANGGSVQVTPTTKR